MSRSRRELAWHYDSPPSRAAAHSLRLRVPVGALGGEHAEWMRKRLLELAHVASGRSQYYVAHAFFETATALGPTLASQISSINMRLNIGQPRLAAELYERLPGRYQKGQSPGRYPEGTPNVHCERFQPTGAGARASGESDTRARDTRAGDTRAGDTTPPGDTSHLGDRLTPAQSKLVARKAAEAAAQAVRRATAGVAPLKRSFHFSTQTPISPICHTPFSPYFRICFDAYLVQGWRRVGRDVGRAGDRVPVGG